MGELGTVVKMKLTYIVCGLSLLCCLAYIFFFGNLQSSQSAAAIGEALDIIESLNCKPKSKEGVEEERKELKWIHLVPPEDLTTRPIPPNRMKEKFEARLKYADR